MIRKQNKQMIFNNYPSRKQIFLKFCYFFLFIALLSCGTDTSKKEENKQKDVVVTESVTEAKTGKKTILFFGDSLTAGYGLEDINDAFPGLIQDKLDSLDMDYEVINSGLSGETSAGGKSRIEWVLNQKIDVFVLELGANDGLRGVPLTETRENLQAIIDAVQTKYPEATIVLAGMQLPPNMGQAYSTEFKEIFSELAEKNSLALIPFLLEDVGGIPELNQQDGIHPTAEGQKIVANNVWEVLEKVLEK
jgi:acyl-CoA thioesterase-1